MSRKIVMLGLCGVIMLSLCGCKNLNEEKKEIDKLNCSILNNVKTKFEGKGTTTYLITNDGDLYKIGNFSDDTNCKKIDSNLKFERIVDNYLIDNQNNLYEIDNKDIVKKQNASYIDKYVNDNSIVKFSAGILNVNDFYLKNDGIIYYGQTNNIFKSFTNEKILDFLHDGTHIVLIKTDKAYYIRKVKDTKCYKYDDIKCKYEYEKDEELTKKYKQISYIGRCLFEEVEKPKYYGCEYVLKDGTAFLYKGVWVYIALIKCKECGKEISSKASVCPTK